MALFHQKKQRSASATDEVKDLEAIRLENVGTDGEEVRQPYHFSAEDEKRVVRKMDWRIPPLVSFLYLLSFLDRSNIGNARIAGMSKDLQLHGNRYDWLLTIFYITYVVFEFLVIMWKIVPPHMWASFIVLCWGIIATCQSATQSWAGMMACRFFLGVAEAGFGPGVPYLLSFFYLRHELGFRSGVFLASAPLANTFAGALAYGITSGHAKIASWRLLFLVEGLPTILAAPLAFFFLPDSPEKARFLTAEEKEIAKARGVRQVGQVERTGSVDIKDIGLALMDAKNWFTALMYFSCNVSFSSLPVFLPTILSEMGFSSINAQGLTAPPYFLSWIITILTCYIADRTKQRGLMITFLSLIGGIGYIILGSTKTTGPRYFAVFLAAAGVFPGIANILPWVLNNQGSDTRRGTGIAILNIVGQCGPLLGTRLYPMNEAPNYIKGHYTCAAFMFFTGILALTLRQLLAWENKQLDRKYGTVNVAGGLEGRANVTGGVSEDMEASDQTTAAAKQVGVAEENYGPSFRFIL
ncbi:MAG: hypothetical protein M1819_002417 [Sarea resinae]|nr:MAG: hypothetical protein M1819_002417 [Sarea resinae]